MTEDEYIRSARLARHHKLAWGDFWREHRLSILADFPAEKDRRVLVQALMDVVLMGMSSGACKPIVGG
jgi:hypothetical protein